MIGYAALVLFGSLLGLLVLRFVPDDGELDSKQQRSIALYALVGALGGAFALELPADLFGWSGAPTHPGIAIGGRTVLGGLLGGWIAVELRKRALGIEKPTGDRFAISVAIALCFGRLGCFVAGCCTGPVTDSRFALPALDGTRRIPVPLVEAWFHGLAALALVYVTRRGHFRGYRFSIYVTCYAVLRLALEPLRASPVVLAGLTYYPGLAIPLALVASVTWWRRARAAAEAKGDRRPATT